MNAEEKAKQIEEATNKNTSDGVNDDEIFHPDYVKFTIGDRTFDIKPLTLKQMKFLVKLSKINLNDISDESINTMLECLSEILREKDIDFLEENIDTPTLLKLFEVITAVNYKGIPKVKKSDKVGAKD